MSARVSHGSIDGFETVVVENRMLRAVIIPALGGRVWELEDRVRQRQWIWHRPGVPLSAPPTGASYDDVWAGGWEELFPNDAPGEFEGRQLPDHGEWWAMKWCIRTTSDGNEARLILEADSRVVRAHCVKEFLLASNAATLSVVYRIRSAEPLPFHFLFKQHLAVAISPSCRLQLPGGSVQSVDTAFSRLLPAAGPFDWPTAAHAGRVIDLQEIPPASSRLQEFVYVRDLPQPWCGVVDQETGATLRMEFDPRTLPYLWLFLTYGGWRDLYTAVLEPCSNMPKDLDRAVAAGQAALLSPGDEFKTSVSVTLSGPGGG